MLLTAQEGSRLWEILVDPQWPLSDQPLEVRRDLAREAVRDLVGRGWIRIYVARGWPEQSTEEPTGQDLTAILEDEASWQYDDQAALPGDQVKHIEVDATETGLLAIKSGAAADAYRRLDEFLNRQRHE